MTEVNAKKVGSVEKALRILKRKLEREGTIKNLRHRRYYEKPSSKKYKKMKKAKYVARLQAKEDRLWR